MMANIKVLNRKLELWLKNIKLELWWNNYIFQVFDADHSGELDFAEFVKVPSATTKIHDVFKEDFVCNNIKFQGLGDVHNEKHGEGAKTEVLI